MSGDMKGPSKGRPYEPDTKPVSPANLSLLTKRSIWTRTMLPRLNRS